MSMWEIVVKIIGFVVAVGAAMFFAGSETALVTLGRVFDDKKEYPSRLAYWIKHPQRVLVSILIGNACVVIGASALATSIAVDIASLNNFPRHLTIGITTVLVTGFILIFGEIFPKTFARENADRIIPFVVKPLYIITTVFKPLIKIIVNISNVVIRILGGENIQKYPLITEKDIRYLITIGGIEGLFAKDAAKMMQETLKFEDTIVREVMTPRVDIDAIDLNKQKKIKIDSIIAMGHSRIPVYRGDLDNIQGIIYIKDLLNAIKNKDLVIMEDLIRTFHYVPETMKINVLLREFKQGRLHMAVVVDEYGITSGIVTIEDLIEEIVGEILDEYDEEEKNIETLSKNEFIVKARTDIDEVNERLKIKLPAGDFETIGGFVIDHLGRVAKINDEVIYSNIKLVVTDADSRKIKKIKITIL